MTAGCILTVTRPKWAAKSSELKEERKAPTNKMKTFMIVTAVVAIGFMFGRAMTHTAEFFLQAIKKNNEEDR